MLGEFHYRVDFDAASHRSGRVVVIYAENGTGKTNFLKAVHHLLNPKMSSLRALADLVVDDMTVTLRDGSCVALSRPTDGELLFTCTVVRADGRTTEAPVRQEDIDSRAYRRPASRQHVSNYLRELGEVVNPTLFVGDDRLIRTASPASSLDGSRSYDAEGDVNRRADRSAQSVTETLERVERDFIHRAIRTISGDTARTGDGVYADITRRVLEGNNLEILAAQARASLLQSAERVLAEAPDYEKYGLLSFAQVRRIAELIEGTRANSQHLRPLHGILEPYFTSTLERIRSLADTQKLIDTFVTSVNSFLERKTLTFSTEDGIRLIGKHGDRLEPDNLSSGEKHLLLLLSHAVLARSNASLVVIDEPELSLGLRWQRQLIGELVKCTEGSGVQFLAASHSVQVMGDLDDVVRPTEVVRIV